MTSPGFVTLLLTCLAAGSVSRLDACDRATFESVVRSSASAEEIVDLCGAYWLGSTAEDRRESLRWVVGLGRASVAAELMGLGYQPTNQELEDLLFSALEAPDDPFATVELLIAKGANVEAAQQKFHLVYHAIELKRPETLRILLSHMSDESALYDPLNLFAAVSAGDVVLLEAILARHGDPDFVEDESNVTPLMAAVDREVGDEVLRTLIRHGADCWKTDRLGDSPLSLSKSDRVTALLRAECGQSQDAGPD
jgi:hypothetical protein